MEAVAVDRNEARRYLTRLLHEEGANNLTWVWCLHCGRLQQGRHLRTVRTYYKGLFGLHGDSLFCHYYPECDGAGIGIDLWPCDDGQHPDFFPAVGDRKLGQVVELR